MRAISASARPLDIERQVHSSHAYPSPRAENTPDPADEIVIVQRTTPSAAAHTLVAPVDRESAGRAYEWYVLGLLVLIYIMGTVDRAVLSVIAEPL